MFRVLAGAVIGAFALFAYAGQHPGFVPAPAQEHWRLYRNAFFADMPPVLIASFDSDFGDDYNKAACEIERDLSRRDNDQRPLHLEFWCAKQRKE